MGLSGNLQFLTLGTDIGGCASGFNLFNGVTTFRARFTLLVCHQEIFTGESILLTIKIPFIEQSTPFQGIFKVFLNYAVKIIQFT